MKALLPKLIPDLFAFMTVLNAAAVTHYVNWNSPSPTPPYTNWTTAARRLQDAVGVSTDGETVVVTNGIYSSGGLRLSGLVTNRVALTNQITLLSVNGPRVTFIHGGVMTRAAYVGSNSVLGGFTLAFGATAASGSFNSDRAGGGAWCQPGGLITNCIIVSNQVNIYFGGGVYGGELRNCLITRNVAYIGGGVYRTDVKNSVVATNGTYTHGAGAASSHLENCVIRTNRAIDGYGGGAYQSTLVNCSVVENYSAFPGGGVAQSTNYNGIIFGNTQRPTQT